MKRGFALLETIIVITFLSVSLLLLYGTFSNMINNSKKNILYDDVSNIYKAYYLKEYLSLNNKLEGSSGIRELSCDDFSLNGCGVLFKEFNINKLYITLYDLKDYDKSSYSSYFNNYIDSLSNKGDYEYRFIVEFKDDSYASLGLNGEDNE